MKKVGISHVATFATALALVAMTPMIAFAQFGGIDTFLGNISTFINNVLIPLVFAIALLVFIYGVFQYFILGGGDSEKQEQGRQLMLYAVVGFVVMVSIFGIVNLISGGLGLDDETINVIPDVPSGQN